MRYIEHTVAAEPPCTTVYQVLRLQLGASDGCVRRAKHVHDGILLEGESAYVNAPVEVGQKVALAIDGPGLAGSSTAVPPEHAPVSVLYADDDLLVVDKPAGLVMYPSPGHAGNTLANRLAGWLEREGRQAGLQAAHRLDRETSGVAVFALNSFAKDRLQGQLHSGAFLREYLALCEGCPSQMAGVVDVPLGLLTRSPRTYGVLEGGKPSTTHYEVLRSRCVPGAKDKAKVVSLLRLKLETGRTHQIRIHLASIGCPLLGDATYGSPSELIDRAALHSWRLQLVHPVTGDSLALQAPLPPDMQAIAEPRESRLPSVR